MRDSIFRVFGKIAGKEYGKILSGLSDDRKEWMINMKKHENDVKIGVNLKAIETLKGEILSDVAQLYKTLAAYDEDGSYNSVVEDISTIVALSYILARRLGIGYSVIDDRMNRFLTIAEEANHELEAEFSDMSTLRKYIKNR